MWIAMRPLITLTVLLTILPSIRVPSSHAASQHASSAVLSQLRLVPNPASADASTDGGNRLIWTSGTGTAVLYDLRTKRATVVATSQAAGGSIGPIMLRGHWIAYIDDPESSWTGTRWILKVKDLRTGKTQIISRADPTIAPQIAEGLRPTIALSKTALVWNDWRKVGGKIEARVHILYLNTQRSRVLARSTANDLVDVAASGTYAAWSRLSLAPGARASTAASTLWLDFLPTGKVRRIDVGKGASEASMWGPYLVYKASATRYENGNVYLYDMRSGRTTQLTDSSSRGEVDAPSVGASIVAWNGMGTIGGYDLATRHRISLHPGDGGRAYTAGHLLIYVASTNPKAPEHSPYALVIDRFRSPKPLRPTECVASDLRISANWQGVNTAKIGGVLFSARGTSTCAMRGRPRLALYADGRKLKVRQKPGALLNNAQDKIERAITVAPGHQAAVEFDWVNWCARRFRSPVMLRVAIPGSRSQLSTYVRYGYVKRSNATPACLAPSQPSTIYVGFIRSVTPQTPLP